MESGAGERGGSGAATARAGFLVLLLVAKETEKLMECLDMIRLTFLQRCKLAPVLEAQTGTVSCPAVASDSFLTFILQLENSWIRKSLRRLGAEEGHQLLSMISAISQHKTPDPACISPLLKTDDGPVPHDTEAPRACPRSKYSPKQRNHASSHFCTGR